MTRQTTSRKTETRRGISRLRVAFRLTEALTLALLLLLVVVRSSVIAAQNANRADDVAGVWLLATDPAGLVVLVNAPEFSTTPQVGADGRPYTQIRAAGFDAGAAPRRPDLPQRSVLVALPPQGSFSVAVEVLEEHTTALVAPIYPAPDRIPETPADPQTGWQDPLATTGWRNAFGADAEIYAGQAAYPASLATLEEIGYVRDQRLARLTVAPFQYLPGAQALRHVQQMRVRIAFHAPAAGSQAAIAAARPDLGGFDALLAESVINLQQGAAWRSNPPAPAFAPVTLPLDKVRYRITVRETGIYSLTYAVLADAGLPLATLDPRRLQLFAGNDELAIEVVGQEDGRFDLADLVRFYATAVDSPYTDINALWLVIGDAPGRRMATRAVMPTGADPAAGFEDFQRFETDRFYRSNLPMASGADHWYWGQTYVLNRNSVHTLTVPFTLTNVAASGAVTLSLELWGASSDFRVNPDHHARFYVNGVQVGDTSWSGAIRATPTFTLPQSLLRSGGNTLTMYAPGDTGARDLNGFPLEITWLNFFDLMYGRTFEASDDRLRFTPPAGPGEFMLSGWSAADVLLYDVTDPLFPRA